MSNMIPSGLVAAIRQANNVSVDNFGMEVVLHLLTNSNAIDWLDSYLNIIKDGQFNIVNTKCWIEWKPNTYRLKKLGLFNESDLPILAYFRNDLEIPPHSYIEVPIQFMPQDRQHTDYFEIVDAVMGDGVGGKFADIDLIRCYKIAPLRNSQINP